MDRKFDSRFLRLRRRSVGSTTRGGKPNAYPAAAVRVEGRTERCGELGRNGNRIGPRRLGVAQIAANHSVKLSILALIRRLNHEGHEEHEGFQQDTAVLAFTRRVITISADLALTSMFFFVTFVVNCSCQDGQFISIAVARLGRCYSATPAAIAK